MDSKPLQSVCAIIVTYNRRDLLHESLSAVLAQDRRPQHVIIVDNASTDGTRDLIRGEFNRADVELVMLPSNLGGAGGFNEGVRRAAAGNEYDWLWLMDDDTIPRPDALMQLLKAYDEFADDEKPTILVSRVNWVDGAPHPMNVPAVRAAHKSPETTFVAAQHRTASIRWATFVSALISTPAVQQHGLPYADYFIWNDDAEYTARILRNSFGVVVPASIVVHKTANRHSPMDAAPARFYIQARNVFWMALKSCAWEPGEKVKIVAVHIGKMFIYLRMHRFRPAAVAAVMHGTWHGLTRSPGQ